MYKYYSLLRPVSVGTVPNCTISEMINFNQRKYVDEIQREAQNIQPVYSQLNKNTKFGIYG